LVERSLSEPDQIVRELLQPRGVIALKRLRIESCLEGIDAIPVKGYCVVQAGKSVHIPYYGTHEGHSFHHGRFLVKLWEAASHANGAETTEATVTDLVQADSSCRITGVTVSRKGEVDGQDLKETLFADIVIVANGCFSNFRNVVMGVAAVNPSMKSHFVGAILEDARLPIPNHGTVTLVKGFGPVLLYQISEHDTRILVDVKQPLSLPTSKYFK
jgi:squalene monooxygenase